MHAIAKYLCQQSARVCNVSNVQAGNAAALVTGNTIAIRGSDDVQDWIDNLDAAMVGDLNGLVHQGFARIAKSLWVDVIAKLGESTDKGGEIWLTGHSMGGAVAAILGNWLARFGHRVTQVHTFGQPRFCDAKWASAYPLTASHYRWTNNLDIVPHVPSEALGYVHVGSVKWFDAAGILHEGESSYPRVLSSVANLRLAGFGVEDHRVSRYVEKMSKL